MSTRNKDRARDRAHRDFGASSFGNANAPVEDADPMASVGNLVDAILVFACGLLLALVVHYNVPLNTDLTQATPTGEMTQIDNADEITESKENGGRGYEEMGTAYRDPDTGKYYVKVEE